MTFEINKIYYHKRLNVAIVFKAISTDKFVWNELDLTSGQRWFGYEGSANCMLDCFTEMTPIENVKAFKLLAVANKYVDILGKFLVEKK